MNQDEDLFLRIKLCTIESSDEISFEVFLEHAMEAGDYGTIKSRFRLRPFETSVWEREAGEFIWERPGGGNVILSLQKNMTDSSLPGFARIGAITAKWDETGVSEVKTGQWELNYENGGLISIRHLEGRPVAVRSGAGKVNELKFGQKTLANVIWGKNGNPEKLHCGTDTWLFVEDGNGRLASVTDSAIGATIVEFSYGEEGLVSQVKRIGGKTMTISWRENPDFGRGDSFYKKPFGVAKINDTRYEYARKGNRVKMGMKPSQSKWRHLKWEFKNGKAIITN
jgi:hypothetical protein